MDLPLRIRFFNLFRNLFRIPLLESMLAILTRDKGYADFFVRCIPQNYQYPKGSWRRVKRDGIAYRLDLSEYMEWVIFFGLNVEEREGLYPLVRPGMVILDVGTNIGETLLHFARQVGVNGRVIGFEPVTENFTKCLFNCSLNNFENLKVEQLALSDKMETLYFDEATNMNSGGIFMNKEKGNSRIAIQAVTLDSFVKQHKLVKIDMIKIDVEGFEANVLKGAADTCRNLKPLLFVEVDERNLSRQGSSAAELQNLIRSYGYSIRKAHDTGRTRSDNSHYDIVAEPL